MPYNESDVIQTALRKDANPLKTSNRAPLSEEARKKQNATRASVLELQKELTKVGATWIRVPLSFSSLFGMCNFMRKICVSKSETHFFNLRTSQIKKKFFLKITHLFTRLFTHLLVRLSFFITLFLKKICINEHIQPYYKAWRKMCNFGERCGILKMKSTHLSNVLYMLFQGSNQGKRQERQQPFKPRRSWTKTSKKGSSTWVMCRSNYHQKRSSISPLLTNIRYKTLNYLK